MERVVKENKGPKCPGCNEALSSYRQPKRPTLCAWCGYDHETGEHAQLVPASEEIGFG